MLVINMNQSPKNIILELLNKTNGKNETFSRIAFSAVTPTAGGNPFNSQIHVSAVSGATPPLRGEGVYFYNRLDIGEMLDSVSKTVYINNPQTSWDLVSVFNSTFGLMLDINDIVYEPLSGASYELKMATDCYAFIGSVVLSIEDVPIPLINLATDITVDQLNGFNLPSDGMGYVANQSSAAKDSFLGMLNAYNSKLYTLAQVSFGSIAPNSTYPQFNTSLVVSAKPGSPYTGSKQVFYRRLNIQDLVTDIPVVLDTDFTGGTLHAILNALNATLHTSLRADEVTDVPISWLTDDEFVVTITGTSEVYLPGSQLVIPITRTEPPEPPDIPPGTYIGFEDGEFLGWDDNTIITVEADIPPNAFYDSEGELILDNEGHVITENEEDD